MEHIWRCFTDLRFFSSRSVGLDSLLANMYILQAWMEIAKRVPGNLEDAGSREESFLGFFFFLFFFDFLGAFGE